MLLHPLLLSNYAPVGGQTHVTLFGLFVLKTIVVKSVNNLIVYLEAIKFYNGGKTKGMKGVDLPVFTPLKAVKNPGISY